MDITDLFKDILTHTLMIGLVLKYISFIITKNRGYAQNRTRQIKIGCKTMESAKVEVITLVELFSIKLNIFTDRVNNHKDPLYELNLRNIEDEKKSCRIN